jgi:hypothetical protein
MEKRMGIGYGTPRAVRSVKKAASRTGSQMENLLNITRAVR